ncbi:uncharacterized protein BROUX77_000264 [Berkeleyomyces rouxiae]|uniref:uncharacterized protein n=1 Tax=Berkeleyomyces rouxiae TaxID=2035830 RepID=UPI003B7D95E7
MATPEPKAASPEAKPAESPAKTVSNGDSSREAEKPTNGSSNGTPKQSDATVKRAKSDSDKTDDAHSSKSSENRDKTPSDDKNASALAPDKSGELDVEMPDATPEKSVDRKSETPKASATTNGVAEKKEDTKADHFDKPKTPDASQSANADTSMMDAPSSSSKVSRERESVEGDEPVAKRAKREPTEEPLPPPVPAPDAGSSSANGLKGLNSLERWNDKELEKQPITPYQAREYRRVLAGIKKTKGGGHFKDAVTKLWPTLSEAYLARVTKPMDIGLLERTLRDNPWPTLSGFKDNLSLIYLNTLAFNGEIHEVTLAGLGVVEAVWTRCLAIAATEPSRNKVLPKHMPPRHHEQRHSISHLPPPSPAKSSPTPAPKPKAVTPSARRAASPQDTKAGGSDTYAVPPNGVPQIRRASAVTEGDRPKRTIHPPKSKDIDYSSKMGKKKTRPELEFCEEVLNEIRNSRHYAINAAFLEPVDPVALDIPNYFQVVKKPMDLSTIASKLQASEYQSPKQFISDFDLMFRNCYLFNSPGTPVNVQGKALEKLFRNEWAKKDDWLAKHAAATKAASVSASSVRSDDEFDEPVASSSAAVDPSLEHEIRALEEKMKEESQRLVDLYMEKHPIESMIELQKNMLNMVQASLLKAKAKQTVTEVKADRPSKPKPKPSRPSKGAAPNPGKKSANSNAGRKPLGGASKKKRNITEAEKGMIATAINELSGNAIENAIEIIKRDTNQTENTNGELELDIDQLSNDALLKLWDLCKKNLSSFAAQVAAESHASSSTRDSLPAASSTGGSAASAAAAAARSSAKGKKNKPMSAREQEMRIAHLTQVREQFRTTAPGASPEPMSDNALDSDESDSEEE